MLHLIPAPVHRSALRLAHALRKRWWRIRKPRLSGCRVLALDGEGRVLLVRHAYGSGKWMAPGGGLSRREAPLAGALRELREETGCKLEDAFELTLSEEPLQGATNAVHVVAGWTRDVPYVDGREVIEARFYPSDALPDDMPPLLRARLPEWIRAATAGRRADPARSPAPLRVPTG
jgi:8-oxo-dGTP pyrophosphatase MutT (NUDIX family)